MEEGKEASSEGKRVRRRVVKETEGPEEFDWDSEEGDGSPVRGAPLVAAVGAVSLLVAHRGLSK